MFSFGFLHWTPSISRKFLACALLFAAGAGSLHAKAVTPGLAWQVRGTWQLAGAGKPLRAGDAVPPASLLQPDDSAGAHSITVLLPDGQRVLYECFTVADCARGFRVPSLIHKPDVFAVNMLARIGGILSSKPGAAPNASRTAHGPQTSRQEAVAILNAARRVRVAGLIGELPPGHYTYDLRPLRQTEPPQLHLALDKTGPSVDLALPAAGLYEITITDALDVPRVDLLLAAIHPAQSSHFSSFRHARSTMEDWNDDYAGWPIDDFLRAYLESLMQSAQPASPRHHAVSH
jgi:hypothetical protein